MPRIYIIKDIEKFRTTRSKIQKKIWQDLSYRKNQVDTQRGKKHPEQSKRMKGNIYAFRNRTIEVLCPVCKKNTFKKFKSQITIRYCSAECRNKVRRKLMLNNSWAKGYKMTEKRKKEIANFMSRTRSGKNSPNWKGGVKRQHKISYGSKRYKEWRKKVFERDDWQCQECGIKNCKELNKTVVLNAHHIQEWCGYPKLRFDIDNGITLCTKCHNKTKKGKYTKDLIAKKNSHAKGKQANY